jgi:uncharacterized membrane protein
MLKSPQAPEGGMSFFARFFAAFAVLALALLIAQSRAQVKYQERSPARADADGKNSPLEIAQLRYDSGASSEHSFGRDGGFSSNDVRPLNFR